MKKCIYTLLVPILAALALGSCEVMLSGCAPKEY